MILSHTSHIFQMFDVVLGYLLKTNFSDKSEELMKYLENYKSIVTYTLKIHLAATKAPKLAWAMKSKPIITEKSGIYPINPSL